MLKRLSDLAWQLCQIARVSQLIWSSTSSARVEKPTETIVVARELDLFARLKNNNDVMASSLATSADCCGRALEIHSLARSQQTAWTSIAIEPFLILD